MSAVGRRAQRFVRVLAFAIGAIAGATLTFAGIDVLVPNVPAASWRFLAPAIALALWIALWYLKDGRIRTSLRVRQVRRSTARRPVAGPPSFGFLLGLGWWTPIPSPLFWTAVLLNASLGTGIAAAFAYGLARSWTVVFGALKPDYDPDSVVDLMLIRLPRLTRPLTLGAGILVIGVALFRLPAG